MCLFKPKKLEDGGVYEWFKYCHDSFVSWGGDQLNTVFESSVPPMFITLYKSPR